ncbi:protein MAK16 homolog [Setaria italica]|nr:protein MAK16 homolog [Setaria italica]
MSDDVVWHCIRHGHCSFMAKIETGIFCRNPYNVTGICNRSSCPLANSRYATIQDHDGIFYLYMKTAERAHVPNKLWERVKLPRNYEKAIEVINKHLEFWPQLLVHKIKQRLTKMTQYRIRMRKLQLKVREKLMTVPRKKTQIGNMKASKAELAAKIDNCIQSELLERRKKGIYYPFDNIVEHDGKNVVFVPEDEEEYEMEYIEPDEIQMEMEDIEDFEGLHNGEDGYTDADDDLLDEQAAKKQKRSKIGKRSRKVTSELEQDEDTDGRRRMLV